VAQAVKPALQAQRPAPPLWRRLSACVAGLVACTTPVAQAVSLRCRPGGLHYVAQAVSLRMQAWWPALPLWRRLSSLRCRPGGLHYPC